MNRPYEIKRWRLTLGWMLGAAAAVLYFMIQLPPIWHYILVVGSALAIVFSGIVGIPLYLSFKHARMLNLYVAVLVGGLLTTLPYLIYTVYRLQSTVTHMEKISGATLIINNKLTTEGWWYYFFWSPLWFLPAGMIGGLIAWIVAVGVRVHPPGSMTSSQ